MAAALAGRHFGLCLPSSAIMCATADARTAVGVCAAIRTPPSALGRRENHDSEVSLFNM